MINSSLDDCYDCYDCYTGSLMENLSPNFLANFEVLKKFGRVAASSQEVNPRSEPAKLLQFIEKNCKLKLIENERERGGEGQLYLRCIGSKIPDGFRIKEEKSRLLRAAHITKTIQDSKNINEQIITHFENERINRYESYDKWSEDTGFIRNENENMRMALIAMKMFITTPNEAQIRQMQVYGNLIKRFETELRIRDDQGFQGFQGYQGSPPSPPTYDESIHHPKPPPPYQEPTPPYSKWVSSRR